MKELVAVYGTLKQEFWNHDVLGDSKFMGEDWVSGFEMYESGIPFAVPTAVPSDKIHVEVYKVVDPEVMQALDWLEGHPEHYVRKEYETDGMRLRVWVYTYPHDVSTCTLNPTGRYKYLENNLNNLCADS